MSAPKGGRRLSGAPPLRPLGDRRKGPVRAHGAAPASSLYRGAAIRLKDPRRARRRLLVLGVLAVAALGLVAVFLLPWGGPVRSAVAGFAERFHLGQGEVVVQGNEFLSAEDVRRVAKLDERVPLFRTDLKAVEARLEAHPRIRSVHAGRRFDGKLVLRIEERQPVALLPRRRPVEVDTEGRLLPALVEGAVADRPIVRGLEAPVKGRLEDPAWPRALAWMEALATPEIQLLSRLSEIDVQSDGVTQLILSPRGTRVLLPPELSGRARLAALRIVLADLQQKELVAETIDCRALRMVVVRPVASPRPPPNEKATRVRRSNQGHS